MSKQDVPRQDSRKQNVRSSGFGPWDRYANRSADEALASIFADIDARASATLDWYWKSIRSKKMSALYSRGVTVALVLVGAALPLVAAVGSNPELKLLLTQFGVASLVLAGLVQAADKVFGWSSGWLRYIKTVTLMENEARTFQLAWGEALLAIRGQPQPSDVEALFDMARALDERIRTLQAEETDEWRAEYNASSAVLGQLISAHRDDAAQQLEAARGELAAHRDLLASQAAAEMSGNIQVNLSHRAAPEEVMVGIDQDAAAAFTGHSWVQTGVEPGERTLHLWPTARPAEQRQVVVTVPPGGTAEVDVDLT